ncbi:hypothetical protein PPL_09254 [Heterostelium album PN500]|uniref:Uncharacterized protein n=1 Tax=Heterostelium pallidum (strain ATCC 26659 / Pp 5 / PN500) TaxID=670386 RepID=D3BL22_HETP5|nr:hypothetical protein PPL_09254 [Heterostelium album PN500]EFA77756.1 hypothetical protein PPL_09254 [Heterostelium album PN500]|eukprot:XP_020429884.1 hypothetical protein PPL_09254 [Heterostelium album PN500]
MIAKTIISEATSFVSGGAADDDEIEEKEMLILNQENDHSTNNNTDTENEDEDDTDEDHSTIHSNSIRHSKSTSNNSLKLKTISEVLPDSILLTKDKLDVSDDNVKQRIIQKLQNQSHDEQCDDKHDEQYKLSNYEEIPPYLQGNEFIQTGYRVNFSYRLCFLSIFRLHNETLNIWTHLLATILFFILMIVTSTSILENPQPIDKFIFTVFFICAQAQMAFSTIFHTFCSVSSKSYTWFARLDYCGISLMIVGSHYPPLYYLLKCHQPFAIVYISGITFLGVVGIAVSMAPFFQSYRFRTFRAVFFIIFGLFIVVPLPHIVVLESFSYAWPILWRLAVMGSIYIMGATIYASRCPECCAPGKFDTGWSSHPIWHLFTIVAALVQFYNYAKALYNLIQIATLKN